MGDKRNYTDEHVKSLQGSVRIEHTLAKMGAKQLRELFENESYVNTFGAYNGQQAVQHVKAGLKAIYVSGWQVAASANSNNEVYPDQSLYSVDSVPNAVRSINNAFRRQDQIQVQDGREGFYYAPIIADAEAGFGGALNAYELARNLIEAGAAAVHYEDQLSAEKKCGHLGGKVLVSTSQAIRNLNAARLAADVAETDTLIIARTDAEAAKLLMTDVDDIDRKFMTGERTSEGFYQITGGLDMGCDRGQAFAEYADLVWCETSKPCLKDAKRFADAVRGVYPDQMLAYNCSPSFNWKQHIPSENELAEFQKELGKMGYKFQFITLAGFHSTNFAVFDFAREYKRDGMLAFSNLQQKEFDYQQHGFTTVKHQAEVGVGYFDAISQAVGADSVAALADSTESVQFG
ncbi:MAG: isocitrate lyase [Gammaproteobacteria bacterium]|jgi:isocitrate lyase|nr:isocitrate lyase [Gammaproteobacteria bacterium]MDP6146245.1 isocitrate lyase [Gammaproteobacteria bacterium]|tara:strand:+ start:30367 stop:31578 length:1212 start_codon:yes stop_codon:yes gene_type:complete